MSDIGWPAVQVSGDAARGAFVILCEHASHFIPPELDHLGLPEDLRHSHIAWDPGALEVAGRLSSRLDAPLVAGGVSRLVYDCNRPFEAPDCIPAKSEVHNVPGNRGLSATERRARFDRVHQPFHDAVDKVFAARAGQPTMLLTVHSFTPVFQGRRRPLELGFLFHDDGVLAKAAVLQEAESKAYRAALNAPYNASDGVTYSLHKHGELRGIPAVMVEIRSDLIDTATRANSMADHLTDILLRAAAAVREAAA